MPQDLQGHTYVISGQFLRQISFVTEDHFLYRKEIDQATGALAGYWLGLVPGRVVNHKKVRSAG